MGLRRILAWLALLLGLLGVVGSLVAAYAVWSFHGRLVRTNDKVFETLDTSLTAVHDRVLRAQRRVQETKLTTEEIGQRLRTWAKTKTAETTAVQLEVGDKSEKLARWLQQADQWLETSEAMLHGVQQTLVLAQSVDAPVDASLVDPGVEKLASVRSLLQQATESVESIRKFTAKAEADEPLAQRLERAVPLAARLLVMVGDLDTRLGDLAARSAQMQSRVAPLKVQTSTYIFILTLVCCLLVAWMAAGQMALCYYGCKNCRRHTST